MLEETISKIPSPDKVNSLKQEEEKDYIKRHEEDFIKGIEYISSQIEKYKGSCRVSVHKNFWEPELDEIKEFILRNFSIFKSFFIRKGWDLELLNCYKYISIRSAK